jgi:hypothetical protein
MSRRDNVRAMLVSAIDHCLADNTEEAVLIIESVLSYLSMTWREEDGL